jgi:flagellar hook capping protein FlgD
VHRKFSVAAAAIGMSATLLAAPAQPAPTVTTTLLWTAPGDDGMVGRATLYSLRYSITPIVEATFPAATPVMGLPTPKSSGATETATVGGLLPNTVYFFAIKTRDEAGNWSPISNIAVITPLTTDVVDPPDAASFAAPWPNPARAVARCAFALPHPATVEVDAFSVDGRRIRRLASGTWPAGREEIAWDLRDDSGRPVPAGVYLIRARLGETAWSRRVTVVR